MNGTGEQESLTDWEEIQSPFLELKSTEPDRIVCTSNDDLSVFPPNHHEGLQIPSQGVHVPIFNQEEQPLLVSSPEEEADRKPGKVDDGIGKVLSYGISGAVARIRYYVVGRGWGCLMTFRSVTGVVAVILLSLAYVKVRRWRGTVREERQHKLFLLIKEKDQESCIFLSGSGFYFSEDQSAAASNFQVESVTILTAPGSSVSNRLIARHAGAMFYRT